MNEVAVEDEPLISLFAPGEVDCRSWCPLFHAAIGLYLDFCAVCGEGAESHPADAWPDEFGNSGDRRAAG